MTRALTLSFLLAFLLASGAASAQPAPEADLFRSCPPVPETSLADGTTPLPALEEDLFAPAPESRACFYAYYDEFWKNGEICRYGDSCSHQYYGTCPNGWDYHYVEIFPCCH